MPELAYEVEQHIRPDDILPDMFIRIETGCSPGFDEFPGSRSAPSRTEGIEENWPQS